MSSQNSLNGEIKEQLRKMKDMTMKEKLKNLWYYYKIPAIAAILATALAASLIYHYATLKDYAFYAILINSYTPYIDDEKYSSEFEEYAQIDTDKYCACFDLSFMMSSKDAMTYSASNTEKLVAMMTTGTVDVIIADTYAFEYYAQNECFMNLEDALPKEVLEKYSDYLYYTDADTYVSSEDAYSPDGTANRDSRVINHHLGDSMAKPVPVGIFLPKESNLMETGCYDYLAQNDVTYQGYPSEAILGIPMTAGNIDMALKFLEFLEK